MLLFPGRPKQAGTDIAQLKRFHPDGKQTNAIAATNRACVGFWPLQARHQRPMGRLR
jgi:hypothetical protein